MENLNEGKKKRSMSYEAALREIDAQSAIVAMEAKISKLEEMAAAKEQRLEMVHEDENLSELISKSAVKEMQKEIKEIRKMQEKIKKIYEKKNGKMPKAKEVVDEDEEMNEYDSSTQMIPDKKEDGTYDMSSVGMKEGEDSTYEEDDMKESTNEEYNKFKTMGTQESKEYLRMQKLAGIISEEEYKKRLNENKTRNKIKNTILESIFDKVAAAVKGKSDKESATIDVLKKNGIEVGKPFYMMRYGGGDGEDGENAYWMQNHATPEELKNLKVPVPVGMEGRIGKDMLDKIVIKDVKENEEGTVQATMIVGEYNFKTGKFIDEDGPNIVDIENTAELEKELGGEKEADDKMYSNIKLVPYSESPWVTLKK